MPELSTTSRDTSCMVTSGRRCLIERATCRYVSQVVREHIRVQFFSNCRLKLFLYAAAHLRLTSRIVVLLPTCSSNPVVIAWLIRITASCASISSPLVEPSKLRAFPTSAHLPYCTGGAPCSGRNSKSSTPKLGVSSGTPAGPEWDRKKVEEVASTRLRASLPTGSNNGRPLTSAGAALTVLESGAWSWKYACRSVVPSLWIRVALSDTMQWLNGSPASLAG
mmetsp:Transcript_31178/g.60160  ORF Transcript_31178/g.60160 Transcript_31178/m.60160 type:complete len:222 (+) Transcript_31178:1131-1796(+)